MTTQAQIDKSLAALKADMAAAVESATTMKAKVQHALVGSVSHFAVTGSNEGLAEIINGFIGELGQGINLKAVKAWAEKHLHMQEDAAGEKLVFKPVKAKDLDTKAAAAEMWYSLKPQTVFSFDLTAAIIAMAKKAAAAESKLAKDGGLDVNIDTALLEQLKQLAKTAAQTPKTRPAVAKEAETEAADPLAAEPVTMDA